MPDPYRVTRDIDVRHGTSATVERLLGAMPLRTMVSRKHC